MDCGAVNLSAQIDIMKNQNDSLFDVMVQKPTQGSLACFHKSPEATERDEGGLTTITSSP